MPREIEGTLTIEFVDNGEYVTTPTIVAVPWPDCSQFSVPRRLPGKPACFSGWSVTACPYYDEKGTVLIEQGLPDTFGINNVVEVRVRVTCTYPKESDGDVPRD